MKKIVVLIGILIPCTIAIVALFERHEVREPLRPAQSEAELPKSSPAVQPQQRPSANLTESIAPKNQPRNGENYSSTSTVIMQQAKPSAPPSTTLPKQPPAQSASSISYNGYELQDPMARLVLPDVGRDDEATAYWFAAINDPSLPPAERKDLIEDLNEDGISDPKHPTDADLPLIASRVALIEQLAPYSLDRVNNDAFAEAYKDLVGLLNGVPPK